MVKHTVLVTVIGFVMAGTGLLSFFLSIVGVEFSFLAWIRWFGPMGAFLFRIGMILLGLVLVYLAQTDWEREDI